MSYMFKHRHWGHWLILLQVPTHFLLLNHSYPTPSLVHHTFPEAVFLLDHIKVIIHNLTFSHFVFMSMIFSDLGELNPKLYIPEAETKNQFKMIIAMKYSVRDDCLIVNLFRFFYKEVNILLLYLHVTLVQCSFSLVTADLPTIFTQKWACSTKIRGYIQRK